MASIRSRKSWGARYADGDLTLSGLAVEVFAHHTVTTQLPPTASVAAEEAEMRKVESIGQSRFGTGISYNVIIFPSGRAYQGASWNRRGTHTGGLNSSVRSICFAGNYETNKPTAAQLATAAEIYAEGRGKWWRSDAPLRGHRDVKGTACPGKNIYSQLGAIRAGRTKSQEDDVTFTQTEKAQLSRVDSAVKTRIGDVGTKAGLTWATAFERLLIVTRRTEARVELLAAANAALAKSIGIDPEVVTATVDKAVTEALEDLKITLSTEG